MTPRHRLFFIGIAAVLSATGFGFAWNNRKQAHEVRLTVEELTGRKMAAMAEVDQLQSDLASVEKQRNTLEFDLQRAMKATGPAAAKTISTTVEVTKKVSPLERLRTDPDLQRLKLARDRARLSSAYGPFFRASGLTEAEVERFKEVIIKREEDLMDLSALKSTRSAQEYEAVGTKLHDKLYTEYFSAIRELLGPARYQEFQGFERTASVRDVVSGMASAAMGAGTPFTAEQANQLVNVLAEAGRLPNGLVTPAVVDWVSVFKRAESILSPSQLEVIKTVEPRGPRGAGSRYLIELHKAIDAAEEAELGSAKD